MSQGITWGSEGSRGSRSSLGTWNRGKRCGNQKGPWVGGEMEPQYFRARRNIQEYFSPVPFFTLQMKKLGLREIN